MKFVLVAAVVSLTSLALPVAAKPCDENAPEAMKRPGGYCEIMMGTQSLSTPSTGGSTATADAGEEHDDYEWTPNEML
jgi:hypothetical protein